MPSHAPSYSFFKRVSLSFVHRGFELDLCPEEYCMFISCMLHPSRRNWSRGRRQSGSNASTSSHCVTLSVSFSHFHPPCFIPSPSKHFISSSTPIHFFFFRWLYFEHWFPIPDWRVTAAPHLIIHEMQKLEKKIELFLYRSCQVFLFVCLFCYKNKKTSIKYQSNGFQ